MRQNAIYAAVFTRVPGEPGGSGWGVGWRYISDFLGTSCIGCQDMKPLLYLTQLQGTEESPPQYHPCGPPRFRNGLYTV